MNTSDPDPQAQDLVDGLLSQPWGQVSPSVYETGRVASLTPWLSGHARRIGYLIETQGPDGRWGPVDAGYALVPTLSAVEALLREDGPRARAAAERGLSFLRPLLGCPPPLPDMPALELISASLLRSLNTLLSEPLPVPEILDDGTLDLVRTAAEAGSPLPEKLVHALEILGDAAEGMPGAGPEATGTVGAAPAATAAWLGAKEPRPQDPARRYLEIAARPHGGPVPCGLPITVFERAWVLSTLSRAGFAFDPHPDLLLSLSAPLGPRGAPTAAGLPPDADTTSGALYALALLGSPVRPDMLWVYETETNFCTWPGEQGMSVSTNAHVLEVFGKSAVVFSDRRYRASAEKAARWLRERQRPDGSWEDRWHASPYYATMTAALALHDFGGPESAVAVSRAVSWIGSTRRADGSWGVWGGTAEETAYALQVLLLTEAGAEAAREAVPPALEYLSDREYGGPALWHDKDLYFPQAIVRSAVLAATRLARLHLENNAVG